MWVAHQKITTNSSAVDYESSGSIINLPSTMKKGETVLIQAELTSVTPFANYSLSVFNPLGYDDVFHIGAPELAVGGSYECNDQSLWKSTPKTTISGSSTGKYDFNLLNVLNSDSSRDLSNADNKFLFKFPLTALSKTGQYAFTVALQLGEDDIHTLTQDITVEDQDFAPSKAAVTVSEAIVLSTIYAGGAAVFYLEISVGAGSSFDFKITGTLGASVEAIGLYIHNTGSCGGFTKLKIPLTSNDINADFGTITNGDATAATKIELFVSFKLPGSASGSVSETLTIAGNSKTLSGTINAAPAETEDITGVAEGLGPLDLNMGFGAGISCRITIPKTVINKPLTFMIYPNYNGLNVDLELCKVEIKHVGAALPCILKSVDLLDSEQRVVYSKSDDSKLFYDTAKIDLGTSCPIYSDILKEEGNQFNVTFIFDLPEQKDGLIDEGLVELNAGLYVEGFALWTTMYNVTTKKSTYVYKRTYVGSNTHYSVNWETGYTDTNAVTSIRMDKESYRESEVFSARFLYKQQRRVRGKMRFRISSQQDMLSLCRVEVLQVGKNYGCFNKPSGYTDKGYKIDVNYVNRFDNSKYGTAVVEFSGTTNYGLGDTVDTDMYADDDSIEFIGYFQNHGGSMEKASVVFDPTYASSQSAYVFASNESKIMTFANAVGFSFVPVQSSDSLENMHLMTAKTIGIQINGWGDSCRTLTITFSDKDFSKKIDFCSVYVTKVGANFPCVNEDRKSTFPSNISNSDEVELDDLGNPKHYKSISLYLGNVCPYNSESSDPDASKIQVEVTFRANENANDGDTVTLEALAYAYSGETKKEITITISNSTEPTFQVSNTSYPLAIDNSTKSEIESKNVSPIAIGPGQFAWVPFNITVPRESTVPISLAVMTQHFTYFYNQTNVEKNMTEAAMTIHDVRFSEANTGINICCMTGKVDPWRSYSTRTFKSENLTSFMQEDSLMIDLGYVTNAGFTYR